MTHTDHLIPVTKVATILGIGVSTAWLWCTTKAGFPTPFACHGNAPDGP
jgi:predicted DNA-binding transcriptional regulator AlpA